MRIEVAGFWSGSFVESVLWPGSNKLNFSISIKHIIHFQTQKSFYAFCFEIGLESSTGFGIF